VNETGEHKSLGRVSSLLQSSFINYLHKLRCMAGPTGLQAASRYNRIHFSTFLGLHNFMTVINCEIRVSAECIVAAYRKEGDKNRQLAIDKNKLILSSSSFLS